MDRDVISLVNTANESEVAVVASGVPKGRHPVETPVSPDRGPLAIDAPAKWPDVRAPATNDALAALKEIVDAPLMRPNGRTEPAPEVQVPVRDTCELPAHRPRGRKLLLMTGVCAVLVLGWLVSSNTPSIDLTTARIWIQQSGEAVTESLAVARNELQGRFEQLTQSKASAVQADQSPLMALASPTEAFERSAQALATKLDQLHASSEGSTREIRAELELLKTSVERSQAELTSMLSQVIERVERMEQAEARPQAAAATPPVAQVVAAVPTPPPAAQVVATVPTPPPPPRPTPEADAKLISPPPAEARREPVVIKQWTVREVLNGMALLEGPRGLVGVSPGQTLPGIGRVESIVRQGGRWVVATSNGVITGRVGPQ